MRFFLLMVAAASASACSFDSSGIETKEACVVSLDCLEGRVCVAGSCVDQGEATRDTGAADIADTTDVEDEDTEVGDTQDVGVDLPIEEDFDSDGVRNEEDNCPETANPGQEDHDLNGVGDHCQRPERSSLVLTEIRRTPVFSLDAGQPWVGQFIEVHNRGEATVDLDGFVLRTASESFTVNETLPIEPGAFAVLAGSELPSAQGAASDLVYGSALTLPAGGAGELHLERDLGSEVIVYDTLAWDDTWAWVAGTSLELRTVSVEPDDNNLSSSWCPSGRALASGADGGTPGEALGGCLAAPLPECGEGDAIDGDVILWGRTDIQGATNNFNYLQCQGGTGFEGSFSNEVVWSLDVDGPVNLRAEVQTPAGFAAMVYIRSGCSILAVEEEIACARGAQDSGATIFTDLTAAGRYHLFVDGGDSTDPFQEQAGPFTLEVSITP